MSIADWIALGIIAFAVVCAVVYMVKHRNSCGNGCAGCPYSGSCGKKGKERKNGDERSR